MARKKLKHLFTYQHKPDRIRQEAKHRIECCRPDKDHKWPWHRVVRINNGRTVYTAETYQSRWSGMMRTVRSVAKDTGWPVYEVIQ